MFPVSGIDDVDATANTPGCFSSRLVSLATNSSCEPGALNRPAGETRRNDSNRPVSRPSGWLLR